MIFTKIWMYINTKYLSYREFYWANYATGLGASLHELGHTFDLAHTPSGIMARGFDDINKVFIVQRSHGQRCSSRQHSRSNSRERMCSSTSSNSSVESYSGSISTEISRNINRNKDVCFGSPRRKVCIDRYCLEYQLKWRCLLYVVQGEKYV